MGRRLDETGTLREPEGTRTASAANHSRVTDAWTEVPLPPGTRVFHEVEVRVSGGRATAVASSSWGRVKGDGAVYPQSSDSAIP